MPLAGRPGPADRAGGPAAAQHRRHPGRRPGLQRCHHLRRRPRRPGRADTGHRLIARDALRPGLRRQRGAYRRPRAALLTGRYPWRFGVEFTPTPGAMARVAGELYADPSRIHPVIIDREKAEKSKASTTWACRAATVTMAEVLKARGYHTVQSAVAPGQHARDAAQCPGFDETLFMESGLYRSRTTLGRSTRSRTSTPSTSSCGPTCALPSATTAGLVRARQVPTDYFTDEAVNVIRRNRHRPFLLYLAHWGCTRRCRRPRPTTTRWPASRTTAGRLRAR